MANKDSVNCYSASLPVSSVSGSSHNPRFVHPCKRKLVLDNSCGSGSSLAQRMRDSSPTPPRKAQRAVSQSATSPQALVPRVILLARNRDTSSPQQSSVAQSSVSKDTESLPVQSDTSALPVRVSEREHASQPVAAHPALPTSPTRGPFRGQPPMAAVAHARPSRGGRGGLLEIPRNFTTPLRPRSGNGGTASQGWHRGSAPSGYAGGSLLEVCPGAQEAKGVLPHPQGSQPLHHQERMSNAHQQRVIGEHYARGLADAYRLQV